MAMPNRFSTRVLVHSTLQILVYMGSQGVLYLLTNALSQKRWFFDVFGFRLSLVLFAFLLLAQNLLTAIFPGRWLYYSLLVVVAALFLMVWGEGLRSLTAPTVTYLVSGLAALGTKVILDWRFLRRS
ncbi:MAG: hypothetical protein EOP52_05545 [Sphingobacteriales bacterium]|nr:MAG: hypothetical protein EOP52_05545 [Sphingobacteriales bacterium]